MYQNKVTVSLASIHNCKMAYWPKTPARAFICIVWKFVVLINLLCVCNKNEILIKAFCLLIVFSTVFAILIQLHYCSINYVNRKNTNINEDRIVALVIIVAAKHQDCPVFTVFLTIKASPKNILITLLQLSLKLQEHRSGYCREKFR